MNLFVEELSGVHVVRIAGERAAVEERILSKAVMPLLDTPGVRIVIDLSQVKIINSSSLGELVTLTAQANQYESQLVLAGPSAFVAGVFETTQLNRFFRVYPSVEAAIASLA